MQSFNDFIFHFRLKVKLMKTKLNLLEMPLKKKELKMAVQKLTMKTTNIEKRKELKNSATVWP